MLMLFIYVHRQRFCRFLFCVLNKILSFMTKKKPQKLLMINIIFNVRSLLMFKLYFNRGVVKVNMVKVLNSVINMTLVVVK